MFCHYCGNQLPDVAVFCNNCGKKVPTLDSPHTGQPSQSRATIQFSNGSQAEPGAQPMMQAGPPSQPGLYPQWTGPVSPPSQFQSPYTQGQPPMSPPSQWTGPVSPSFPPQWTGQVSPPSQPQHPSWQPPSMSQTDWTVPVGPPPNPWQSPSRMPPTERAMPPGMQPPSWIGAPGPQTQWTSPMAPAPPWQSPTGTQSPWTAPRAPLPPTAMQRLLIRIFQPNLAGSAVLGVVLGGIVAAIAGALVSGMLLAIAHALGQHAAQASASGEDLVDYVLGIWPLHSPFRDSLQLFLVMHGVATHIQSVSGGTDFSNATVIEPLHGLLVIPALLLTLGGYIAASTDMQNRLSSSIVRGAAIAIPYTILLLIMATSVNGSVSISAAPSSEVDTLNVDVATLIIFGLLWGTVFGLLGASLKLARGQWRHLGFQYLRTSPRPLLNGMITGGLAAVGLAMLLSLLMIVCLLTYSAFALPLSGENFNFGIGALSLSLGGSWQIVLLRNIAWGPLYGVNLFIFAFGGPIKVSCSSPVLAGGSGNPCFNSGALLPSISLFGGSVHLSPWIYVLLALPALCLFLGGRVSVAAARTQGVGPAAVQGALIAAPFTVLMMLLTLLCTFTFGVNNTSSGNNTSYTISFGASAIDLLLWALLSGAVFGALGGMYQVSPLKVRVSRVLFALGAPFRLLCRPVYFVFDRLSGLPPSSQRSPVRSLVYCAFACALLLAVIAGVVGGLLIADNQSLSFDTNRLIKNILYLALIALPGLLLVSACASALAKDPLESPSQALAPSHQLNVPTAHYGQGVY